MSTPRRNSYAVSFKVSVVEWQRKNEASIHRTAKYFSIDRKRVCDGEKERSEGRPVSNQLLKTKAIQIAGGLKIAGFRASCGWLSQWKQQYNVGVRAGTNNAQKILPDYADLHSFRKSVITICKAENIGPADIVNMNQTMCRFDMPPSRTNNKKGERTIRIKTTRTEEKGFTVSLAATASGKKLPAVIVFKDCEGSLGVCVRRSLRIPPNVRVRATPKMS